MVRGTSNRRSCWVKRTLTKKKEANEKFNFIIQHNHSGDASWFCINFLEYSLLSTKLYHFGVFSFTKEKRLKWGRKRRENRINQATSCSTTIFAVREGTKCLNHSVAVNCTTKLNHILCWVVVQLTSIPPRWLHSVWAVEKGSRTWRGRIV